MAEVVTPVAAALAVVHMEAAAAQQEAVQAGNASLRVDYGDRRRISLMETTLGRLFEPGWRTGFERRAGPPGNLSLYYVWAWGGHGARSGKETRARSLARTYAWALKRAGCNP